MMSARLLTTTVLAAAFAVACGDRQQTPSPAAQPSASPPTAAPKSDAAKEEPPDEPLPPLQYEAELPASVRDALYERFTRDLDEMVKRRLVRLGVTYNRTNYFVDNGVQRGATYEYAKLFEDRLNTVLKTGNLRIHVVCVPLPRDMFMSALTEGRVDVVEGQLTITPDRQALVDFGVPTRRNVSEIVVTPPDAPPVATTEALSGREVFVRKSSSYYQSLLALNNRLEAAGRPPVEIIEAPESLEDEDLLEMANASLVPAIVVDDYLAAFWHRVLPNIRLNSNAVLRSGGQIASAYRKNSPILAKALADFTKKWGPGTTFGNIIRARYLQSTRFVTSATVEAERRKFEAVLSLFRQYGSRYRLDYLLMAAQGYQESRLDQNAKSAVGAIGVMQVMPATGAELNVGDIHQIDPNVHAGVKYIRVLIDRYLNDPAIDDVNRILFAFASYNAGPGRIRQLRRETARRGLDPNIWFGNVEQVVSARVGRETVDYVSNIYKYYVAYRLVMQEEARRAAIRAKLAGKK